MKGNTRPWRTVESGAGTLYELKGVDFGDSLEERQMWGCPGLWGTVTSHSLLGAPLILFKLSPQSAPGNRRRTL